MFATQLLSRFAQQMRIASKRILAQSAAVAQAEKGATVMRKVTIGLLVLGVLALAFISMPMRAQNQGFPYQDTHLSSRRREHLARISPSRLCPLPSSIEWKRAYPTSTLCCLMTTPAANLTATINALASAHGGVIKNNYGTFLKGFSVRM